MRRYHLLAQTLLAIMLLNACMLAPAPDSPEPVTITFAAQEHERQSYKPLIAAFQADNPDVRVQFVGLDAATLTASAGDIRQIMRTIASAADTADFFLLHPDQLVDGYARDLKPFMDADPSFDKADFYAGALEAASQEDRLFLLPHSLNIQLLAYNKDVWEGLGLPKPALDWTWKDVRDMAARLAEKQGDKVTRYGLLDVEHGAQALKGELILAGADRLLSAAEQVHLTQPEFAAALAHVVDLTRAGTLYIDPLADGQTFQQFIHEQKVSMWSANTLLPEQSREAPFTVGMAPFPPLPGVPTFFAAGYLMSSGTLHPQESWRWLSFLSKQAVQRTDHDRPTQVPARRSIAVRSGYWDRFDADTVAAINAVLDRAPKTTIPSSALQQTFTALAQALLETLRGSRSVADALLEAQSLLDQQRTLAQQQAQSTPAPVAVATPLPEVAGNVTTITYANIMGNQNQISQLAQTFGQANPNVVVELKDRPAFGEPLQTAKLAAGADCFPLFVPPPQAEITATLNLQPFIDADPTFNTSDYPQVLLTPFRGADGLHGLPYAVVVRTLNFNQTAFEHVGLTFPGTTWTLDDFVHAAQRLTSGDGETKRYGFAGATPLDLFFFLDRLGVSTTRGDGDAIQPNFTDPAVRTAIMVYLDVLRNYSPHQRLQGYAQGQQSGEAYQLFMEGRVGMMFGFAMDSIHAGGNAGFTAAMAPPPFNGMGPSPNDFYTRGLYISATTAHAEACWAWLKQMRDDASVLSTGYPARMTASDAEALADQMAPEAAAVYNAYRTAFSQQTGGAAAQTSFYQLPIDYYWFFDAVDQALQGQDLEAQLDRAQSITAEFLSCTRAGESGSVCALQVDPTYQGLKNAP